jgi:hypothetical protein
VSPRHLDARRVATRVRIGESLSSFLGPDRVNDDARPGMEANMTDRPREAAGCALGYSEREEQRLVIPSRFHGELTEQLFRAAGLPGRGLSMIHRHRLNLVLASAFVALGAGEREGHGSRQAIPPDQGQQAAAVRRIGGTVFESDGVVVEVNLNRTGIKDADLDQVSGFTAMTDLSLEETAIGDDGLRRLSGLKSLVWLNLYRTRVGDDGLSHLKGLTRLAHLPIGETRVTDAGLVHLVGLRRLTYLGLRGDRITDAGLPHLGKLTRLTGLNLAQTDISDRGLVRLKPLVRLKTLRLDDTHITGAAIATLAGLGALEELYVIRTDLTIEGVRRLKRLRPACRIYYRSDREPE